MHKKYKETVFIILIPGDTTVNILGVFNAYILYFHS